MFSNLRRWIASKVINWEEFWLQTVPYPIATSLDVDKKGEIVKNERYYKSIDAILNNKAFINEIAELQDRHDKIVRRVLADRSRFQDATDALMVIHGIKSVNGIIATAHNKVTKDKR